MDTDGVFVAIGRNPNTAFLEGKINLDENGYIITEGKTLTDEVHGFPKTFTAQDAWRLSSQGSPYTDKNSCEGLYVIVPVEKHLFLRSLNGLLFIKRLAKTNGITIQGRLTK